MSKYDVEGSEKFEAGHMTDIVDDSNLAEEQKGLKRDLRLRHMVMIAISGTIGTGLFLTTGTTIVGAGPGGAMIAYALIGIWLVFVCQAIGEVATLLPLPGAFNAWGARVFDEAFSFQMTWMYFINWALTVPAELSAVVTVVKYWVGPDSSFPPYVVPIIFIVIIVGINLIGVSAYGEAEYWFSVLKVVTIILFIICGILVDAGAIGGVTYGMTGWKSGAFTTKLGFFNALVSVGYSYGGTEMSGVTAAESRNPHKHVPKAVNTVLLRIAFFYIISVFLLSSIVSKDDPLLLNADGTAATSPFTIVLSKAGIKVAASYMNAVIFTSVFSATNSDFYVATRMLLSLARNGWAPRVIGYTNSRGVPIYALTIVTLFSCISLITIFVGSGVVFEWLVSIIGSIIFQSWILILFLHFRFRYCWKAQGRAVEELPYVSWGYPYGNIIATLIGLLCIGATNVLSIINTPSFPGTTNSTTSAYIQGLLGAWFPWVFSAILYFGYKFTKGTKIINATEADLDTGRFIPTESDKADITGPKPFWKKVVSFLV
ncbi:hypothetical protein BGZ80_008353 [Entomortierella chlamydospora]|uniref:Amino acid permease/ SLC12A domain-containing protein n=1 Tax=Entomortierella chlamydospora TaxID=101097 RepID=A0A9P6T4T7_9FUNG|nr:hypothetical protein BGZ79_006117 [Entomortierella chlamydospora]KAG0023728.1 hypothetical protein BGZ80_008353 [Entomortierella chlamydospora]